jgi:5-methyltetrahydropteroyltriglutamate--homocysteine methyltransferase
MPGSLPALPTVGVGSYAAPGWFQATWRMARKGELGPHDVDELFDDAIQVVVNDQLDAGVDILTDGELRRQRFVYEMFDRLEGLERVNPRRRLGIGGYDMAPHYIARGPVTAPEGLGAIEEYRALKALAPDKPLKLAIPGPLTFLIGIDPADRGLTTVTEQLIGIVREELTALEAEGCAYVQIDEPGLTEPGRPLSLLDSAKAMNASFKGLGIRTAVHVCFGNNAGRPMGDRRMGVLLEAIENLGCTELSLEFANREMADIEMLKDLSATFDIAAGVVDVKNFFVEPAELVAERIEQVLEFVPAERLRITSDCGFSALPRFVARQKLGAMVEGAKLARDRLG